MWVYLLLLIVVFVLLIFTTIYIIVKTHQLLKDKIKNKVLSWLLSLIPIIILIIGFFIDTVNAIVFDLHVLFLIAFSKLIILIIEKLSKKKLYKHLGTIVGLVLTVTIMTHAYYLAHHVVQTDYTVYTTKDVDNFRIVQVSDSHLGCIMDGKEFSSYMEKINELNPDIVVLTGDFIDDGTSYEDMVEGAKGLGKLKTKYGVYFIYGNHDKGYYNNRSYGDSELRNELSKNNVTILEDNSVEITDKIVLIGRQDAEVKDRVNAEKLTKEIDKEKYIIMLDHQPNDYANEQKAGADLVLSGHTHGGQLIPLGRLGVLLGANDSYKGMIKIEDTTFIINVGIGDWAIKFKTGTITEYTVIDIRKE